MRTSVDQLLSVSSVANNETQLPTLDQRRLFYRELSRSMIIKHEIIFGHGDHGASSWDSKALAQMLMREAALRASDESVQDEDYQPSIQAGELEVVASVTMRFKIVHDKPGQGE